MQNPSRKMFVEAEANMLSLLRYNVDRRELSWWPYVEAFVLVAEQVCSLTLPARHELLHAAGRMSMRIISTASLAQVGLLHRDLLAASIVLHGLRRGHRLGPRTLRTQRPLLHSPSSKDIGEDVADPLSSRDVRLRGFISVSGVGNAAAREDYVEMRLLALCDSEATEQDFRDVIRVVDNAM